MAVGVEWRSQISSIIAETERNLGMKTRRPTPAPAAAASPTFRTSLPAPSSFPPPLPAAAASIPLLPADGAGASSSYGTPSATSTDVRQLQSSLESSLDAQTRSAQTRTMETVKFELDVRGSLIAKQLEAVREEMHSSMAATEKKWLDIAKGVETSTAASLEAESKLREHTDTQLGLLRDASSTAHQETMRVVGEFQQTAIDHSEVLRRLDADLSSFRQSMETK